MSTAARSTVVGVFHDRDRAKDAVHELRQAGFTNDQVGFVGKGKDGDADTSGALTGAATGAAVGAGAATLASLGITFGVIPVIGPILAVGPLAAALLSAAGGAAAGAAAGGLIGALTDMGVSDEDARYYEGEFNTGRYLVTVKAGNRYDEAWAILRRHGAYNRENAATGGTSRVL